MERVEVHIVGFSDRLKRAARESVSAINRVTAKVKQHEKMLKSARLRSAALLAGEILLVKNLVGAYAKQEQADAALAQAMKNRGIYTDEAYQKTKNFADEMQRLTTFGNEEVEMAQTLLVSVGKLKDEALDEATKATLDLAAAKKMDLKAAADLVSKSIGSTTNALSRYGIQIREGVTDPTERASLIVKEISKTFGGQAAAQAQTYTGQLKQLGNVVGDLKEDLGQAILPMIMDFAKLLRDNLPAIREWVKEHSTLVQVIVGGGIGGAGLVFALSQLALAFTNPVTGTIAVIALATLAVIGLSKALMGVKKVSRELPSDVAATEDAIREVSEALDEERHKLDYLKSSMDAPLAGASTIGAWSGAMKAPRTAGTETNIAALEERLKLLEEHKKKLLEAAQLAKENEDRLNAVAAQETDSAERAALLKQEQEAIRAIIEEYQQGPEAPFEAEAMMEPVESKADKALRELTDVRNVYEDSYYELEELFARHVAKMTGMDEERVSSRLALAEYAGEGVFSIISSKFERLGEVYKRFDKAFAAATVGALINTFNMLIDAAIQEVMAEKIKHTAKLIMLGVFDWSAIGKIAAVAAAAGLAKSQLTAMGSSLTARLSGRRFKYGGVLPETGWFFGEAGERVFNPNEPVESGLNSGGLTVNWYQTGPIRDRRDAEETMRELGERIMYGGIGRRMATT